MLRLIQKMRAARACRRPLSPVAGKRGPAWTRALVRRDPQRTTSAVTCWPAAVGLVLGMGLGRAFVYPAPEPPTAMYKRSAAFVRACEAAGVEIARLRRARSSSTIVLPPS